MTTAQITAMDRRIAEKQARAKATRDESSVGPSAGSQAGGSDDVQPQPRKGERWATYNAFIDLIAPRLTLADRAVWHVMFRHARDGKCKTTARQLATAASVSISTAQAALSRLGRYGLVRPIWKSVDKSKPSIYGIHPRPADCLGRVLKQTNRTDDRHG